MKAFYKHGLESEKTTVPLINDVLTWRKEFECKSNTSIYSFFFYYFSKKSFTSCSNTKELLTPGKLPFPEKLFNIGAMFMKNKDINGVPLCKQKFII